MLGDLGAQLIVLEVDLGEGAVLSDSLEELLEPLLVRRPQVVPIQCYAP
jgi:hypothetical protein